MTLLSILLVGTGGAIGAVLRYYFSEKWNKEQFPSGTLFVNLTGSFLLGTLIGASIPEQGLLIAGTGIMGALTTFSTFQLEGVNLLTGKKRKRYLLYLAFSYIGGITAAFAGLIAGKILS